MIASQSLLIITFNFQR